MSFQQTLSIEQLAREQLVPFLRTKCAVNGSLVLLDTDRDIFDVQTFGDAIYNSKKTGLLVRCEFKAELENKYENFFLETWSNRTRRRHGWLTTSKADVLCYQFVTERMLFVIGMRELQSWAIDEGKWKEYPEKPQAKYEQANDTWGICVPINHIRAQVGFKYEGSLE